MRAGTVIFQTDTTSYANAVKARIVSTDEGGDYIDWRTSTAVSSTGFVSDHGSLSGLADDDHAQYVLADGTRQVEYLQLNASVSTPTYAEGLLFYDNDSHTLGLYSKENDVTLNIGQEQFLLAVNKQGAQINNGQVVYVNGAQGNRPAIYLADATDASTSESTIGIATHNIQINNDGFITIFGLVRDVNTSGYTAGDILWLSETAGAYTGTRPGSPAHAIRLGYVIVAHATEGIILVSIDKGSHLAELHDVYVSSPSDGQTITYVAANSRWENTAPTGGSSGTEVEDTDVDTWDTLIDSFSTSTGDAAWWDYVIKNTNSGTSMRAGTVISVWDSTGGTVEFYDTSTNDIGDTSGVSFLVDMNVSSSEIQLTATTDTDNWTVRVNRRTL